MPDILSGLKLFKRELTPAQVVKKSREDRFMAREIIDGIFTDFVELHGDRLGGDDMSIIGGIAFLADRPVTVIVVDKGTDIHDKLSKRNGSPEPWGYRKAQRLMQQAMISIIYGEGGSGGALALATADQVWMFQNATYSILSPEGFASILWKDSKRSEEAAAVMGLTAKDLLEKNVIEYIIPESRNHPRVFNLIRKRLNDEIHTLNQLTPDELLTKRRNRFRAF